MKTIIFLAVSLILFTGCKKDDVTPKTTTGTTYEVPSTIQEAESLIQGTWTCDSVQKYNSTGYVYTEIAPSSNTFNNGICSAWLINETFQYNFLNATTMQASNWGSPTYNNYFATANKLIIIHLNTDRMILRCVHSYYLTGEIASYDLRYYRR